MEFKSVLHIGFDTQSHSKEGLRKGFISAGFAEYHFFNWQNARFEEGILGCQSRMIQAARSIRPDLLFLQIQNNEILDEETVIELSKCGFTVNFTFDCRNGEQTEWYYELAPHFGLTLFACREDEDEARLRGIRNVGHIHSSCDPDFYRPIELSEEEKRKYPEIVFLGCSYKNTNLGFENCDQRVEMVEFMKKEFGDKFMVAGMNWGSESRFVNPIEEVLIYNSAKLIVCHNNYLRTDYCSDRQWRAMACGTLTVPQYYKGLKEDFPFRPFPYWETLWELKNICNNYLREPPFVGMRNKIASDQRDFFLKNHLWKNRILSILDMIKG